MTIHSSRREFLKRASALGATGVAAPMALNMASISSVAAANATDYKALVCVFLYGGNDYANTVIPYDLDNFNSYKTLRPVLHIPRADMAGSVLNASNPLAGRQYALSPSLKSLAKIFNTDKKLAVLANVGTLIEPTTKTQLLNRSVKLPPKIASHNDQQSFWQAIGVEGASTGWGGRMGDILMAQNPYSSLTCISPNGNSVFLAGKKVVQYQSSLTGAVAINGIKTPLFGSRDCSNALLSLLTGAQPSSMGNDLADLCNRAINNEILFNTAIKNSGNLDFSNWPVEGVNALADQLRLVLKAINAGIGAGNRRQVFLVGMGGFDTHDGLDDKHPQLLQAVADAMSAFYDSTVDMGIADKVTTFTGSDFGRSWGNNDGSDHGWGSYHFVMGGAVKGGQIFGTPPAVANGGPDDFGQGRLIPTTSVDQVAATLGKWMGLSDNELLDVLPNLKNFTTRNMGFMA
jgi:uncharacterized protein (DUF1501 family)